MNLDTLFTEAYDGLIAVVSPNIDSALVGQAQPRGVGQELYRILPNRTTTAAGALTAERKTAFGFMGFYKYGEVGEWAMKLYGGYIDYARRFSTSVADTPEESPGTNPFSPPQVTGTILAPCVICIEMNKSDNSLKYVSMPTEPTDSDSYWYYKLHTAYLNDEGSPVYVRDRRSDWRLGSPIG